MIGGVISAAPAVTKNALLLSIAHSAPPLYQEASAPLQIVQLFGGHFYTTKCFSRDINTERGAGECFDDA